MRFGTIVKVKGRDKPHCVVGTIKAGYTTTMVAVVSENRPLIEWTRRSNVKEWT